MSDTESTPAPLGASDAQIPAENGYRKVENATPPSGSNGGLGSDGGVAARTRHWVYLRTATGGSQGILPPVRIAVPRLRSDSTADHAHGYT